MSFFFSLSKKHLGARNPKIERKKKSLTFVVRVGLEVAPVLDVVKVLDAVLLGHVAQDVDVAVGARVRGEDVVVLFIVFFVFFFVLFFGKGKKKVSDFSLSPPCFSPPQKKKARAEKKRGRNPKKILTGMMITASGSHTRADSPNSFWKIPNVPGPHTSCVISLSTLVHTLSPGRTERAADEVEEEASESMWLERIFSVIVMARLTFCFFLSISGGERGREFESEEREAERLRARSRF